MSKVFEVGSKVWVRGKIGEVFAYRAAACGRPSVTVVVFPEDNWIGRAYPTEEVWTPASSLFKIGQSVCSAHSFVGKVTAFEEETNRVICISTHNAGNRKRYAYLPTEIFPLKGAKGWPPAPNNKFVPKIQASFNVGKYYTVTTTHGQHFVVKCIESAFDKDTVALVVVGDAPNNHRLLVEVPKKLPVNTLGKHGIRTYLEM